MADTNKNGQIDYDETSRLLSSSEDFRNCSIAKNGALYTPGDEYNRKSSYIISCDGDGRGRDPQSGDQNDAEIGTTCDQVCRTFLTARNAYNCGNEYGVGSGNV